MEKEKQNYQGFCDRYFGFGICSTCVLKSCSLARWKKAKKTFFTDKCLGSYIIIKETVHIFAYIYMYIFTCVLSCLCLDRNKFIKLVKTSTQP